MLGKWKVLILFFNFIVSMKMEEQLYTESTGELKYKRMT